MTSDTAGSDFTLAHYMERAKDGHVGYLYHQDNRNDVGAQYRAYIDQFCDVKKCEDDYQANLKVVMQPAKAQYGKTAPTIF